MNPANHDDVNAAFKSDAVLTEPDARLLQYLRVLCTEAIHSDQVRLLAANRCAPINTILTQRFTRRYTWIVIALATATLIATVVQVCIALR